MPMSRSQSSWALGHLSNRQEVVYETQNILVKDRDGRLRFTRFTRLDSRLPPELVVLIFLYCLPDDEFVTPSLTTAPLLLSVVCRRWREIAFSTPKLWSSLSLEFTAMRERRKEAMEPSDFLWDVALKSAGCTLVAARRRSGAF
ncbi:hypothetical protein MVEN_02009100 [Mycena venus]|uniref:F-box domain-containing protein n=1 Tax=Mycena venus TaxID=2733690 RepID=A0A8H6XC85_9AGAR|nr:hypothetical protein MVEN_02009100 [Mycena venus]